MKIAHITTFGPNGAGLYEASRNMMKADFLTGHEVYCVDTGITPDLKQNDPKVGVVDDRGDFKITTSHHSILDQVDLIVMHTYCDEKWYVKNQVPIVWIVHGRPAAAFRQELDEPQYLAYSAYGNVSYWPRVKKLIHFWPEYSIFYDPVIKKGKQCILEYPCIDTDRFTKNGKKFDLSLEGTKKNYIGEINGLICDPRRNDINRFEIMIGAIYAAKKIPGLKWHFVGLDTPIIAAEERLLSELEKMGSLGLRIGRIHSIEEVYRACDFLYTPHNIITQTCGEAVATGLKVIANIGNKIASQCININNPIELIDSIYNLQFFENKKMWDIKKFGQEINKLYLEVV